MFKGITSPFSIDVMAFCFEFEAPDTNAAMFPHTSLKFTRCGTKPRPEGDIMVMKCEGLDDKAELFECFRIVLRKE